MNSDNRDNGCKVRNVQVWDNTKELSNEIQGHDGRSNSVGEKDKETSYDEEDDEEEKNQLLFIESIRDESMRRQSMSSGIDFDLDLYSAKISINENLILNQIHKA